MTIASDRAVDEYNGFGPWVGEVRDTSDVPPLFDRYPIDFSSSRVLKFPRSEARRDLRPGMDLYDHLLVLSPERLVVLARGDAGFTESSVGYSWVTAITDSVDLLDGRLDILTLEGENLSLPYNGSSSALVAAVVNDVRTRAWSDAPGRTVPGGLRGGLVMDSLGKQDNGLVALFADVTRAEPDVRLIAAHGRQVVFSRGGGAGRLIEALRPTTLHGMVVCGSGSELQILSRRATLQRGGRPTTSLSRTVVATRAIDAVTSAPHPVFGGVSVVTIALRAGRIALDLPAGSVAERSLLAL